MLAAAIIRKSIPAKGIVMAMHEIEVWVVVDGDGVYDVGKDEESACEQYAENVGGHGTREVCIRLTVEVPETVVVSAVLPAKGGKVAVKVSE